MSARYATPPGLATVQTSRRNTPNTIIQTLHWFRPEIRRPAFMWFCEQDKCRSGRQLADSTELLPVSSSSIIGYDMKADPRLFVASGMYRPPRKQRVLFGTTAPAAWNEIVTAPTTLTSHRVRLRYLVSLARNAAYFLCTVRRHAPSPPFPSTPSTCLPFLTLPRRSDLSDFSFSTRLS